MLPAVLDAIARQRVDFPFETIAVDSASTDGTADLLRRRVDRVISIPDDAFDHGLTRNLGIEQARGRAGRPAGSGCGAGLGLVAGRADRAAVRGRADRGNLRTPAASARCERRHALLPVALSRPPLTSRESRLRRRRARARSIRWRLERCTFDNVCSCIRRSVWAEHPFSPRRSPRTSSGRGRCCWRVTSWRTCRRRLSSIPTIGRRGTSCCARTCSIAGCTNCSGCARFRRCPLWSARSLSSLALHARCERDGRWTSPERARHRSGVRVAARPVPSARCRRSEAGSRCDPAWCDADPGSRPRLPAGRSRRHRAVRARARARAARCRRRGPRARQGAGSEPGRIRRSPREARRPSHRSGSTTPSAAPGRSRRPTGTRRSAPLPRASSTNSSRTSRTSIT